MKSPCSTVDRNAPPSEEDVSRVCFRSRSDRKMLPSPEARRTAEHRKNEHERAVLKPQAQHRRHEPGEKPAFHGSEQRSRPPPHRPNSPPPRPRRGVRVGNAARLTTRRPGDPDGAVPAEPASPSPLPGCGRPGESSEGMPCPGCG